MDKSKRYKQVYTSFDVYFGYTSLDLASGVRALICGTLNGSTQIVNVGTFSPERFFHIVEKFKVTLVKANARMANELLHHPGIDSADLSSVKMYICGGSKLTFHTIHTLEKYLRNGKFVQNYGLNETVGSIVLNLKHTHNDCVGQLISGCNVKIINDQGERLGVNEIGELCLKLPHPFLGYLNNVPDINSCIDKEGFLKSGDLARFDENGDLFVVDRKNELFECRNCLVIPTEIEAILNKIDGVKESCVVPIPDKTGMSVPVALIIKTNNSSCTERSIYDAVSSNAFKSIQYCFRWKERRCTNQPCTLYQLSDNFTVSKLLDLFFFIDALPLTVSGKIARNSVKQMAIELFNNRNNVRAI